MNIIPIDITVHICLVSDRLYDVGVVDNEDNSATVDSTDYLLSESNTTD